MASTVRLYLGGLPPGITCEQLQARFEAFGRVEACHIVPPKTYAALPGDEGFHRRVGFVTLHPTDEATLRKCMSAYNGSKWRGHVLKCQLAKEDYKQRLQREAEEEQQPSQQELAQRRRLPPLEPGGTLRVRHPSRPTTVDVQLCSGQRVTSFPPAPPAAALLGAASCEPLPTPPGARYTFEARLRAAREQGAARRPVAAAGDEGTRADDLLGGAAIQYSPTATLESDDEGHFTARVPRAAGRQQQQQPHSSAKQRPRAAAGQASDRAPQRSPPKRQRVVDFTDGDEDWDQPLAVQLDLSRFGSDSEGEGEEEGAGTGGVLLPGRGKAGGPAARAAPSKQQPAQMKQRQQQQRQAGQRRQQEGHSRQLAGQQLKAQAQAQVLPPAGTPAAGAVGLDEERLGSGHWGGGLRGADLSRFASDSEDGEGQRPMAAVQASPPRKPAGPPAKQEPPPQKLPAPQQQQQRRQQPRAVVEFLSAEELLRRRKRPAMDLSRFGSDSEVDSGELPPADKGGGRGGRRGEAVVPQLDGAWDSSDESSSESDGGSDSSGGSGDGKQGSEERASERVGEGGSDSGGSSSSSPSEEEAAEGEGSEGAERESGEGDSSSDSEGEEQGEGNGTGAAAKAAALASNGAAAVAGVSKEAAARQAQAEGGSGHEAGQPPVPEPAPAWMARLLPAGAAFLRQEPVERLEAAWRVGREGWAQDWRSKHRQAVRHLNRPVGKKQRRK